MIAGDFFWQVSLSRILLYSDLRPGVSDAVDECLLQQLAGTPCRVGYIPSQSDPKRRYFTKIQERYLELGISDLRYLDLGAEYEPSQVRGLLECDAIHLSGGDPFPFLDAVKKRGFRTHLNQYLDSGGVLIGVSAGAMILSRSLGLADEVKPIRARKNEPKALKLFDFEFYPHFQGDERTASDLACYAKAYKTRVYACDDNGGIFLQDTQTTLLGPVVVFDAVL